MYKVFPVFIALVAQAVFAQDAGLGGTCESIAGPTPCQEGLICCPVAIDYSICYDGKECPKQFLHEGDLCSGFAGPSPYPCWPGLQCCNLGPDRSVCAAECPEA